MMTTTTIEEVAVTAVKTTAASITCCNSNKNRSNNSNSDNDSNSNSNNSCSDISNNDNDGDTIECDIKSMKRESW